MSCDIIAPGQIQFMLSYSAQQTWICHRNGARISKGLWVDRYREARRQLRFMPDRDVTSSSGAQVHLTMA